MNGNKNHSVSNNWKDNTDNNNTNNVMKMNTIKMICMTITYLEDKDRPDSRLLIPGAHRIPESKLGTVSEDLGRNPQSHLRMLDKLDQKSMLRPKPPLNLEIVKEIELDFLDLAFFFFFFFFFFEKFLGGG